MAVRHQLAQMVGFESHAHRMTSEKMAETPDEVMGFLEALSAGIKDKAEQEVGEGSEGGREGKDVRVGRESSLCCVCSCVLHFLCLLVCTFVFAVYDCLALSHPFFVFAF